MGETGNVSKIAEILSKQIFSTFGWTERGPRNENWECVDSLHNKKTHPSDIVFYYLEPYEKVRTFINCDLKSYSCSTISTAQFESVINNLAMAARCAKVSPGWSKLYSIEDHISQNTYGLLFIYNHDSAYDAEFYDRIKSISDKISIPKGVKVFIISPKDVLQLFTIATDIKLLSKEDETSISDYSFFYPDLDDKKIFGSTWKKSATIEMLTGPWIILQGRNDNASAKSIFIIYYRNEGSSSEEFVYLIDYLFNYQLITDDAKIIIRGVETAANCASNLESAKNEYCSRYHLEEDSSARVNNIQFESVNRYIPRFEPIDVGMEVR